MFLAGSKFLSRFLRKKTTLQLCLYSTSQDPQLENERSRLLRVSIIGVPNAGKSTLVNRIINHDVCPVSKKAHTTRKSQKAMYLEDNTQVVFMDTPGLVNNKEAKKFSFIKDFVLGPERSMRGADLLAVIHDVRNPALRNKLDHRLLTVLKQFPEKQSILILNKVDTLGSKRKLLETVKYLTNQMVANKPIPVRTIGGPEKRSNTSEILNRAKNRLQGGNTTADPDSSPDTEFSNGPFFLARPEVNARIQSGRERYIEPEEETGWSHFQDIFMVSALEGDGVEQLKDYFVKHAKEAPWDFKEEVLTDCVPEELAVRIVKSRLLEHLSDEIPYIVSPVLEFWEENSSGILQIVMVLDCPNERFVKIIIGKGGENINVITSTSEKAIAKLLRRPLDLQLRVTCSKKKESKEKQNNYLSLPYPS